MAGLVGAALVSTVGCSLAYVPVPADRPTPPEGETRTYPAPESTATEFRSETEAEGAAPGSVPNVVHVVQPGQTLWRIAAAYGIDLGRLAEANGITDPSRVAAGSALIIPGATRAVAVPPYPLPPTGFDPERPLPFTASPSGFSWPLVGEILSPFGASRGGRKHQGIDIRGARGAPIHAARPGRVIASGHGGRGYGLRVVIDHGDGYRTVYAHADGLLVRIGDEVDEATPIARVGRTGNATSDHLHFEIRRDGTAVDPASLLQGVLEARR